MEKTEAEKNQTIEEFEELREKFNLPNLESLGEDFDIEKSFEKESSFLLREMRRIMTEKTSSVLHLFENLINPSSPPIFIFSGLKKLNEEDKKKIKNIYKILAKIQIKSMKCDSIYSENSEAELIKNVFDEWKKIKQDIFSILEKFEFALEEENNSSNKSYFG